MRKALQAPPIHPDPCPELIVERGPDGKGVGAWVPNEKHRLLFHYLQASSEAWRKWPRRTFIDPFAGPGRIQVAGEEGTRDGGAVVAWHALAEKKAPFTSMLVGDLVPTRAQACERRLAALGTAAKPFVGPAVVTTKEIVRSVARGSLSMAYIDPYNLELLDFSILQELATLDKVDLAINFSTMDLQRNAEFEFDPQRARFDGTAPGWRQDSAVVAASRQNVKLVFFQYWCRLVQSLGFEFSKEMPLVHNDAGQPLYRMVFFARHDLPNRIWGDVARGPNQSFDF